MNVSRRKDSSLLPVGVEINRVKCARLTRQPLFSAGLCWLKRSNNLTSCACAVNIAIDLVLGCALTAC